MLAKTASKHLCTQALREIEAAGVSAALFGTGWTYEHCDSKHFARHEEVFWYGVHKRDPAMMPILSPEDLAALTSPDLTGM